MRRLHISVIQSADVGAPLRENVVDTCVTTKADSLRSGSPPLSMHRRHMPPARVLIVFAGTRPKALSPPHRNGKHLLGRFSVRAATR
jgi:hypothetical protein